MSQKFWLSAVITGTIKQSSDRWSMGYQQNLTEDKWLFNYCAIGQGGRGVTRKIHFHSHVEKLITQ